jgi:hypothetical protein
MIPQEQHGAAGCGCLAAVVAAILVILGLMAFSDPNLNIPVISPLACSVKGDTWYGGGILGPPGCYAPGMGMTP